VQDRGQVRKVGVRPARCGSDPVRAIEFGLLGIAALGIVGWQVADDPVVATGSVVVADLIGVALMLPKTYRQPGSETISTYAIGVVSTLCALAAVNSTDASLWIYPIYILIADGAVVAVIRFRRRALALAAS
jgi:hypothetical protein